MSPATLAASDVSARLAELLRNERLAMAEFLVALSDFDRDRGWVELKYTSLFQYLTRELRLSKGPAFYRMTAAHLIQEYPDVVEPLRDGRLCLSTVVEVSNVVTRENLADVLPRFFGRSKQEAKEIAAELRPRAVPSRTVVMPLAGSAPPGDALERPRSAPSAAPITDRAAVDLVLPEEPAASAERAPWPRDAARAVVEPRTAELSRMHVTVTRELVEKLAAARDALSHSHPDATDDEILVAGLDLLLERTARRRGLVKRPRARRAVPTPSPTTTLTTTTTTTTTPTATPTAARHRPKIPAEVRRAVWTRDQGRCQFRLASGEICGSTRQVELHHTEAYARGGGSTTDDLEVRCKPHNVYEAREEFGDTVMDRYTRLGRGRTG